MMLREIAHSRAGDKGNTLNLSVIAYDPGDYELIRRECTVERVRELFKGMVQGDIRRYEVPNIAALNFVLTNALAGGVTRTLRMDPHGKSLSSALLTMEIERPGM
ncbi:MAG: hypothetical protein ACM3X4_08335 [Ignavibacteriales bacterium]